MDLCLVEGDKSCTSNDKRLMRYHRYYKLVFYTHEFSAPAQNFAVLSRSTVHQLGKVEEEGQALLQSRNSEEG